MKKNSKEKLKIWFIAAHFDDIEIGCGGSAAKFISEGHECFSTIVTKSGYNNENKKIVRSNSVAKREGLKGLKKLGFKNINCLNFDTGILQHNLKLIYALEKELKRIKPDIVFTHWIHDVHQDHSAIAKSTLTVCRKTSSVLMYRSNWYRTDQPFLETLFIDVSNYYEKKIDSINCHISEVKKFGQNWESFIKAQDTARGMEINVEKAESFQVVKLKW